MTQNEAVALVPGRARLVVLPRRRFFSAFRSAGESAGAGFDSNEYGAGPSWRARNAARPGAVMRPSRSSSVTRVMLTALHTLFFFRGEKRWTKLSSSSARRTPSIQPKHSASSSASR